MSANPPLAAQPEPAPAKPGAAHRYRWAIWGGVLAVGLAAAAGIAVVSRPHSSAAGGGTAIATFAAGARPAPGFSLVDQHGKRFTLASLRGRPVIITFIDPLCRDFCPREATVLTEAAAQLGSNAPAIVSVSVDPWADSRANFAADAVHWHLAPGWRWGTGSYGELAPVWQDYAVGVQVAKKTIAGITIRRITHTGAAYLVDAAGNERALFLYPFSTADVVGAAKKVLTDQP